MRREIDAKTFKVVTSWGGLGGPATKGKFNISHGVAIDHCNRVWVADRCAHQTCCHLTTRQEFRIRLLCKLNDCGWLSGGCGRANARLQIFDLSGKWLATWNCMDEPPYGVRMFGAQESDGSADAAPEAHLLVTGLTRHPESRRLF